jgi:hypothetical protein
MHGLQARSVVRTNCVGLPYVMSCTLEKMHASCVIDPRCPDGMNRTILETEILRLPDWGLLISDRESITPRDLLRPASTPRRLSSHGEFDGSTPEHTDTYTDTLFIECCLSSTNWPPPHCAAQTMTRLALGRDGFLKLATEEWGAFNWQTRCIAGHLQLANSLSRATYLITGFV